MKGFYTGRSKEHNAGREALSSFVRSFFLHAGRTSFSLGRLRRKRKRKREKGRGKERERGV